MIASVKKIVEGLQKAKARKEFIARARPLIDEAPEGDDAAAAEIEAVVRHVCGVAEALPALSPRFRKRHARALLPGLSQGRSLDAWDVRALPVIAAGEQCAPLEVWLGERVERFPGEPILDEALPLLRAGGLWATDADVLRSTMGYVRPHLTAQGALTSSGRWLLGQIDGDLDAVVAAARGWRDVSGPEDRTWTLLALLAAHRREAFDRVMAGAKLTLDRDRALAAEVMLRTDAHAFEAAAVELMAGMKAPDPATKAALLLTRHLPGKHLPLLRTLLLTVIRASSVPISTIDGAVAETHAVALELASAALGDGAQEIWDAYRTENHARRLWFCETIEARAKAEAVPWLVEALVYPVDPASQYGDVTYPKYVAGIAKLLRQYELTPHRERIEQAFARTKDRKIRQEIDALLGGKEAPAPAPRRGKAKKAGFDARKGYAFDAHAAALVKVALAAAKEAAQRLPAPIEELKLTGRDDGLIVFSCLLLEGGGEEVILDLALPDANIPDHVDLCDEDRVLAKVAKLHGLDPDEDFPQWGDMYELPWCVLLHEQIAAARAIAAGLADRGVELAKECRVGAGSHDDFWDSQEEYADRARSAIEALPEELRADFAALCFVDPARQAWLLGK